MHRLGAHSFGAVHRAEAVVEPDRQEEALDVKGLLRKETARVKAILQPARDAAAKDESTCKEHLEESQPSILTLCRSLRGVGLWQPSLGRYEICGLQFDVRQVLENHPNTFSLAKLAEEWKSCHRGIPKAAQLPSVKGQKLSACCEAAICVCGRTLLGRWNLQCRRSALQKLRGLTKRKVDETALVSGEIVLVFVGSYPETAFQIELWFVAVHSLRPWRPTLLRMDPANPAEAERLHASVAKLSQPQNDVDDSDSYITCNVRREGTGGPTFTTFAEVLNSLDKQWQWGLLLLRLSDRQTPFVGSKGLVKVVVAAGSEISMFWEGRKAAEAPEEEEDFAGEKWEDVASDQEDDFTKV